MLFVNIPLMVYLLFSPFDFFQVNRFKVDQGKQINQILRKWTPQHQQQEIGDEGNHISQQYGLV